MQWGIYNIKLADVFRGESVVVHNWYLISTPPLELSENNEVIDFSF